VNEPTDWVSAIAILASGIFLGLLIVMYFNRKRSGAALASEDELIADDLIAKRDSLVQRLRDLDETASPEERRRLESETADVLRRIDERGVRPERVAAPTRVTTSDTSMNPAIKGFMWGAASVAALATLGYLVMQASTPRQEGGIMTGSIPGAAPAAGAPAAPAPDAMTLQLEAAVQKDPENLQLRNDLAQAYLERENLMGVFEQTKFVLEKSPEDSRALTFQGLVRLAMGESEAAVEMLQRATKSDPANLDSWVSLAWVYAQTDRMADAEKAMAEAARRSPENKQRIDQVFAQMKQHVADARAAGPRTAQAGGELPAGHPPVAGGAPAAPTAIAPATGGGAAVQVTLDIAPTAAQKSGVLFVMARNPAGGPPVAVKRIQVASFPVSFEIGTADSMTGQPLPATFRLEARLDGDGDAMTRMPTDPKASQEGVSVGMAVRMALQ
jgi:cytochrome c-type biogenesis protein CcmH/NrfG